ncbi:MAG: hypothetical protein P8J78_08330 [Maricaulis sp.]|jgi:hypothetical protein|nr:hypothetical protein [Maricaulis sp.]MDG2044602.1 hypothetical protein [Maricaulis sp.]
MALQETTTEVRNEAVRGDIEPAPARSRGLASMFSLGNQSPDSSVTEQTIALNKASAIAEARRDDLRNFRQKWNITDRSAIYPKSHILHFSILAGLVLFEGMANAYFFSTGSDLGLLGGWLQAITVSFTNVIAAFFLIGFLGVRNLSNFRTNASWKQTVSGILAIAGIGVTALALFGLNLTAAHYRDLLEINSATLALGGSETTGEILSPVSTALSNPMGFQTLEALLLLILGVTFAVIAAFKGRTFDDAIPGYGGATRRLEAASLELEASISTKRSAHLPEQKVLEALALHSEICRVLAGPAEDLAGEKAEEEETA